MTKILRFFQKLLGLEVEHKCRRCGVKDITKSKSEVEWILGEHVNCYMKHNGDA